MEELLRAHRGGTLRELFGCGTAAVITPVGTLGWKGEDIAVNGGQPGEIARRLLRGDHRHPVRARARQARLDDRGLSRPHGRPARSPLRAAAARAGARGGRRGGDHRAARGGGRARRGRRAGCARTARPAGRASARRRSPASRSPASWPSRRRTTWSASPATRRPAAASSAPSSSTPIAAARAWGSALLLSALHAMRAEGYGYAIIGWASSIDFYKRVGRRGGDRRLRPRDLPGQAAALSEPQKRSREMRPSWWPT